MHNCVLSYRLIFPRGTLKKFTSHAKESKQRIQKNSCKENYRDKTKNTLEFLTAG